MSKTWRERVNEPTIDSYIQLAVDWATCAVGEQHAAYPTVVVYTNCVLPYYGAAHRSQPVDPVLHRLGGEFPHALILQNVARANEILDEIEDRVLQLKRGDV